WKKPLPGQYHPLPPAAAAPGYGAPGPYSYPATGIGGTTYEQLPDDTGWLYEGSPLERGLANLFRHSYLRVEYLNWSYTDPGNNILGSPTNFVADPTVPFPETNP